tara:strand:- start:704 stop:1204 length:501 start_codon:yes stop_codon:yes gene_type:complete
MLKNFKDGYQVSSKSVTAKTETKDCVVRAIANACDVNYEQAHELVKLKFKRKKGEGTKQSNEILKTLDQVTFDQVGQLDLFNDNTVKTFKHLGDMPKLGGDLINIKYKHKKVAYTVKAFAQKFKHGNYIVLVNKHALAINDGVIIDNSNYQAGGYRRVVESAFAIV